jgi:hypothetical protein
VKWILSLGVTGILTLALLDLGLLERERFPFASLMGWSQASPESRTLLCTILLIVGLYASVRALFKLLPSHWLSLDDGSLHRLPAPKRMQDRIRVRETRKRRVLQHIHIPNARWMSIPAVLCFVLIVPALPVVRDGNGPGWAWAVSLIVPLALLGCAFFPDKPRSIVVTDEEVAEMLALASTESPSETPVLPDSKHGLRMRYD